MKKNVSSGLARLKCLGQKRNYFPIHVLVQYQLNSKGSVFPSRAKFDVDSMCICVQGETSVCREKQTSVCREKQRAARKSARCHLQLEDGQ